MKFHFRGAEYSIEFKREHKEVTIHATGEVVTSKYPYTTARVVRTTTNGGLTNREVVRTATVGALKGDTFTHEGGRLAALRAVTRSMTDEKDFKKAMWKAYTSRRNT